MTKQLRVDLAQALSDKERLRSGRARAAAAAAAAGADGAAPETKKTRGAALEAEVLKLNRQLLGVEAENDRLQRTVHVAQAQQILKLEAQVRLSSACRWHHLKVFPQEATLNAQCSDPQCSSRGSAAVGPRLLLGPIYACPSEATRERFLRARVMMRLY